MGVPISLYLGSQALCDPGNVSTSDTSIRRENSQPPDMVNLISCWTEGHLLDQEGDPPGVILGAISETSSECQRHGHQTE